MIVLDTNVVSGLMASPVDSIVVDWLNQQPNESIWITSLTVYEVRYGLALLPEGKRRRRLEREFEATIAVDLQQRVLDFDSVAADIAATISADQRDIGRPVEIRDAMIAGIVTARRAALATRNTKHFEQTGVSLINPWADQ